MYRADWLIEFKIGALANFTSMGNLKCLPTAATERGISVSSIGALFHPYCDVRMNVSLFSQRHNTKWKEHQHVLELDALFLACDKFY